MKTPLVFPGQRVGIMGGSFNPPHDGHRIVAETAVRRMGLDQLWWVVTPGNPLKSNGQLPPLTQRMRNARTFARGPRMKITGFETDLGTPYTAAMLAFLRRRYPGVHFVWVMGADNLASFDRWQHWHTIAHSFPIAVIDRPGWRLKGLSSVAGSALAKHRVPEAVAGRLALMQPPAWTFLTTRLSSQSSTALRARKGA
ncbi:MAG: nicotinate-nucleotide adenylyltransferase [Hyphomicrobium sp.]